MGFLLRKQFEFNTVLAIEPGLERLHLTARVGRVGSNAAAGSLPVQG